MVGWAVILSAQTPEERDADRKDKSKVLFTWETGVWGLEWLQQLVRGGSVKEHSLKGGYPNRYTAPAQVLLPLFQNGPPLSAGPDVLAYDESKRKDVIVRGDQNWNVIMHPERIAACPSEQLLTVEVWDQS
jgi:hypothetical protein